MPVYRTPILLAAVVIAMSLLAACETATPLPTYNPAVTPLTGIDHDNVSTMANANGVTPCGVFDVNGHGYKEVALRDYPDCKASQYEVLCLNDKAAWIADNISDVQRSRELVTFTSSQMGTCGLFPSP